MALAGISRSQGRRRLRRYAGALGAFGALIIAGKACSDLTAPSGVNDVAVQFRVPGGATRLDLIVGDSVRPDVVVTLGGLEQTRARYVFTSSDPAIIRVYANGDSIVAEDRGTATLVVTLVGATIGNNRTTPTSRTADTIVVASVALANQVTPAAVGFQALGARETLQASSLGRNGKVVSASNVVWRSTNPAIVAVTTNPDNTAELTAAGNGTAAVWAIFNGVDSTQATVTVAQVLKRFLLTTPTVANLRSINETMTVSWRAVDSLNNTLVAGAVAAPAPTFISDNPGKIEIDPASGVMTARGNTPDTPVKITATIGGATRSDTLQATVNQLAVSLAIQSADTIRLVSVGDRAVDIGVIAPDALGTQVPPTSISWTSTDPSRVQVVGNALATITAQATGTVVVRARADQQMDSVIVVVTNDPAIVTLTPKPLELRSLDETQTLTATITNTAGTPLTGTVTWISRDSSVAQPQPSPGVILARAVGQTRIVATTTNGRSDSVTVRVTNAPDTVNIVPGSIVFPNVGDVDGTFAVDFKNARGVALPRDAVNWSSQDITIARVLAGTITATGVGSTYIVGVSPENTQRRDSVLVTVTNAAASITISPAAPATLTAFGSTTTFTAVVRNAGGSVITGAPVVWSVPVGSAFVSIDPASGVATAVANGAATVRATSGTVTSDVPLTVAQAIAPARSTIVPAATTLTANGTSSTSVTVRLRDANDNDITSGGATVTLGLNPANGTLSGITDNGNGTYTATLTASTATGTVTISGTVNGAAISNTGVVSYTAGAATQYVVTVAPSLTPAAGTALAISARLADANGNAVATAGNVVTWSSTGGGSFGAATSSTDATGVATVTFTTSTAATQHTVTATTGALSGTSALITTQAGAATLFTVTAATTSPAAGSGDLITAQLRDANGNAVALAGQTVTWTKSDPNGVFSSGTSVTNGAGMATVTLTTHTVSNTATTVTATSGSLTGTSATITTVAGPTTQLTLTQAPSATAQSGVPFLTQPALQVRDANGNPVAQANVSVAATITAGGGSLGGVAMVQTDVNGVATFGDLSISGANGGRTLTFSASGLSSATAGVTLGAGQAAQMALFAGSPQTATAGTTLPVPPSVIVRDASNNPVTGVNVTFTVTGGGGTTSPPSGSTVATDAAGVAALTSWTLGALAGTNTLSATVAGLSGSPVTFTATGTVGAATQMTPSPVGAQTANVNTPVPVDPSVLVRDANNNPVAGVSVTFTVTGGGGSVSSPTGNTVVTNTSGVAALSSWTLGTVAGANSLQATAAGLPTANFTATATPGAATHIAVNAGNGQSAIVGNPVGTAPSVLVRDAHNNAVAAVNVTFTVTAGGGTTTPASGSTVATDAAGIATLTSWTLGNTAGANSITATAAGLIGNPVTFSATGLVGVVTAAQSAVARTGGDNVAANGSAFSQVTVTVRDQHGNPVAGKTVSLDDAGSTSVITAGGGTTSNALGQVIFTVTNTTAETVTYTATANDPGAIVITQTAQVTFVPGVAHNVVALTTTAQNADVGTAAVAPSVRVRDINFNPISGVNVTFTLTATGGVGGAISPASPVTIATDASGVASLTSWTLGQTAGTNNNTVTATAAGLAGSPVVFSASGDNPLPTLGAIAPALGDRLQTLAVVFTGTGFRAGVSTVDAGAGITVNSTTVDSPTQITANLTITAAAATGPRNVTVINAGPGGGTSAAQSFAVSNPAPTLTGIAPANGDQLQTLNVIFTGTGFIAGASTVNVGADITVNSVTVDSPTQITANLTIGAAAALGARAYSVTNAGPGGGTTVNQTFTVNNPPATLSAIAPAAGERLETLNVVFTGTGFVTGVSSVNVGAGITVNSTTVDSPTQITASITIDGAASTGARNFTVTNAPPGGGTSAAQSFTINNPAPTLGSVSPAVGVQGQTAMQVVLTGTGFVAGSVASFAPSAGITINSTTINSGTQMTLSITIAAGAATGTRNILVTNAAPGGGTSGTQSFDINVPVAPTLTGIAPAIANRLQTLNVVLTGTNFVNGVTSVDVPAGITVNSTTVDSPTQITASLSIAGNATLGANSLTVTNTPTGGTSGAQTFTISNPPPTIGSVSPNPVTVGLGGTTVASTTILGTGFVTGTLVDFVEGDVTIGGTVTVDSPTQITVTNINYPGVLLFAQTRNIRVTNAGRPAVTHAITINP
jgi:adhesin/invasin